MFKQSKKRMTLIGVGLKFALISVVYTIIIINLHFMWTPHLSFPIPRLLTLVLGVLLLIIGTPIYLTAGLTIHKYFHDGKLATTGIYAYFRHPIYGAWIVFIMPGIVLLLNSLIGLSIPIFMYVLFRILIVKEDKYLEERFGEEFIDYKNRVGEIFPKLSTLFRLS
ncbi:MAG: isoprenylcysteine carboxylmethyltransferase family protein [Candidatus Aminicenantes bacterium]